jgi:hypothetical protein
MGFLTSYSNWWSLAESVIGIPAVLLSLYIFFKDPINRWSFLGYRPTAILILYDYSSKYIMMIKQNTRWEFPQGGIYTQDFNAVSETVLKREVGLDASCFSLRYVKSLGTVKIEDRARLKRHTLGILSLFKDLRGKGYIAYYVTGSFRSIKAHAKPGYGIDKIEFVPLAEAHKILKQELKRSGRKAKVQILLDALAELEDHFGEFKK